MTDNNKIKILIVDDHPLVCMGLAQVINREKDMVVCGDAPDINKGMAAIASLNPDLVLVDISLQTSSGIDLVKAVKKMYPRLPVLVVTIHDESVYAERALKAGAMGYVMKNESVETVIKAMRQVLKGEMYVSDQMASGLLRKYIESGVDVIKSAVDLLTNRELEIFQLIGSNLKNRDIAEKLHISIKTVEAHRENIKVKLELSDSVELLRHAREWVNGQNPAQE